MFIYFYQIIYSTFKKMYYASQYKSMQLTVSQQEGEKIQMLILLIQVGHANSQQGPTESWLLQKWLLCELCFYTLFFVQKISIQLH